MIGLGLTAIPPNGKFPVRVHILSLQRDKAIKLLSKNSNKTDLTCK